MNEVLHVGCSHATLKDIDYIPEDELKYWREYRLDIDADVNPDYLCSMLDMWAVPSDKFQLVHASHCLEHVYSYEVIPALSQFFRVLAPGNVAIISVPDLEQVCKFVTEKGFLEVAYHTHDGNDIPIRPIDMLYGWTDGVASGQKGMQHLTGFTPESIKLALEVAGFVDVAVTDTSCFNITVVGRKPIT